ncbi:hypothetical protein L9F63_004405 [Diploptera punctata]|uniref:Small ribosomal subunit protein uS15m n=1 Tax=Diploptera punctata TaxID=6984 RepID=A0AAD7ZGZ0_DIPPU|nr:hypothetical protein L9F63_004405 [Diploptera punctata]
MISLRHAFLGRNCNNAFIRTLSTCRIFSNDIVNDRKWQYAPSNTLLRQGSRNYAFKSDLKIKWVRPPKIPCFKPEKSGDLEQLPQVDEKQLPSEFLESQELKTADDTVKKLFTIEFGPRNSSTRAAKKSLISRVQRHHLDVGSMETRIAKMTGAIRSMQQIMEDSPRSKHIKVQLKELIERRKKFLKYLRRWDYKRFEWVLEKLNLVYKSPPSHFHWITRKDSLRKLTDKHCEDVKKERLAAYKASLDAQKIDFLREKIEKLQWIRKEEEECGVEPTILQEEIEKVIMQLKKIEMSKQEKTKSV